MFVVVLNDGQTYTDLEGCVVLDVPDDIWNADDDDDCLDDWVAENSHRGFPVTWNAPGDGHGIIPTR